MFPRLAIARWMNGWTAYFHDGEQIPSLIFHTMEKKEVKDDGAISYRTIYLTTIVTYRKGA